MTVLATAHAPVQSKDRSCVLCGRSHILESCRQFRKMKLAERKVFLRKKGFCYGCMDGRHLSRTCCKRKECQTCGGRHPTLLHYDARQEGKETTAADTNVTAHCTKASAASVISHQTDIFDVAGDYNSLIVPVMLYHKDAPDESIMVYALLDDQSNSPSSPNRPWTN